MTSSRRASRHQQGHKEGARQPSRQRWCNRPLQHSCHGGSRQPAVQACCPGACGASGPRRRTGPATGKPPASPRSSVDGTSVSRAESAHAIAGRRSRQGPSGATAARALGIARGDRAAETSPRRSHASHARGCAPARSSGGAQRTVGAPAARSLQEQPPISFPQLPSSAHRLPSCP